MRDRLVELREQLVAFRDERDWAQFHTLKNLISAVSIEAGELLELTLWRTDGGLEDELSEPALAENLRHECADVLAYLLLISERGGFDLGDALAEKIELNRSKYPVEKSRGNSKKYDRL